MVRERRSAAAELPEEGEGSGGRGDRVGGRYSGVIPKLAGRNDGRKEEAGEGDGPHKRDRGVRHEHGRG